MLTFGSTVSSLYPLFHPLTYVYLSYPSSNELAFCGTLGSLIECGMFDKHNVYSFSFDLSLCRLDVVISRVVKGGE